MRDLILVRGAPGSGKSTWIKEHHLEPYTVSSDQVRLMFSCPEADPFTGEPHISQRNEKAVWKFIEDIVEQRMIMGQFLVIDAQNLAPSRWLKLAEKYRYRVYVKQMDTTQEECLKRNAARPPLVRVPENVIKASFYKMQNNPLPARVKPVTEEIAAGDIPPTDINSYKRLIAVGDIHGCYEPLKKLQEMTNDFQEADFIVFVGDFLDRGLQNREVLELMVSLRNKPNIMFLEGNHKHEKFWAEDRIDEIRSGEFRCNTMPQLEGMDKKAVREWCSRWCQLAYLSFGSKRFLISHAGLGYMPDHLLYVPSQVYIRGGDYEDDVDKAWQEKGYGDDLIQIHGHRNWYSYSMEAFDTSINLNSAVEFGEDLRVYIYDKEADTEEFHYLPNPVHREGMTLRRKATVLADRGCATTQELVELLVDNMRHASGIAEKRLSNNISSFNFTREVFYSVAWDDLNTIARGLFIDTARYRIVARSYQKFFNVNERERFNTLSWLKEHLVFPVKAWRKYNGFLGMMSWNPATNSIFYASKSTNDGEHAQLVKEVIEGYLADWQLETITRYLQDNDVTLLWEICTKADPHIIKEPEMPILLDVVYNTINFKKLNDVAFASLADAVFRVPRKSLDKTFQSWNQLEPVLVSQWIPNVVYHAVEGWVLCDENGYQLKLKTAYYKNYKMLRRAKELMQEGNATVTNFQNANGVAHDVINFMKGIGVDQLKAMSIIDVRDQYLAAGGKDFLYDENTNLRNYL